MCVLCPPVCGHVIRAGGITLTLEHGDVIVQQLFWMARRQPAVGKAAPLTWPSIYASPLSFHRSLCISPPSLCFSRIRVILIFFIYSHWWNSAHFNSSRLWCLSFKVGMSIYITCACLVSHCISQDWTFDRVFHHYCVWHEVMGKIEAGQQIYEEKVHLAVERESVSLYL